MPIVPAAHIALSSMRKLSTSRLLSAFPEGVEVQRMGIRDAVRAVRSFLQF